MGCTAASDLQIAHRQLLGYICGLPSSQLPRRRRVGSSARLVVSHLTQHCNTRRALRPVEGWVSTGR